MCKCRSAARLNWKRLELMISLFEPGAKPYLVYHWLPVEKLPDPPLPFEADHRLNLRPRYSSDRLLGSVPSFARGLIADSRSVFQFLSVSVRRFFVPVLEDARSTA